MRCSYMGEQLSLTFFPSLVKSVSLLTLVAKATITTSIIKRVQLPSALNLAPKNRDKIICPLWQLTHPFGPSSLSGSISWSERGELPFKYLFSPSSSLFTTAWIPVLCASCLQQSNRLLFLPSIKLLHSECSKISHIWQEVYLKKKFPYQVMYSSSHYFSTPK